MVEDSGKIILYSILILKQTYGYLRQAKVVEHRPLVSGI